MPNGRWNGPYPTTKPPFSNRVSWTINGVIAARANTVLRKVQARLKNMNVVDNSLGFGKTLQNKKKRSATSEAEKNVKRA
jgi:hypothetical protein